MSLLVIIRGLPGSGKSTLAAKIQPDPSCVCEADKFMLDAEGNYSFDRDRLGLCHRLCQAKVVDLMEQGEETIVVSNTSIGIREYAPYLKLAEDFDYKVQIISLSPGPFKSVHGVPEETYVNMLERWYNVGAV